jgi:hypothetical protein
VLAQSNIEAATREDVGKKIADSPYEPEIMLKHTGSIVGGLDRSISAIASLDSNLLHAEGRMERIQYGKGENGVLRCLSLWLSAARMSC